MQPAREWEERVAGEARYQHGIEASFDRADAYERLGDLELALESLDRAATLSGGLPSAYRAKRFRWARAAASRARAGTTTAPERSVSCL